MKPITQKHSMSCGIACTASLLGTSYDKALNLYNKKHKSSRGYYLMDIKAALKKKGLAYKSSKIIDNSKKQDRKYLKILSTIVFIKRSKKYPHGHYLLKTSKGWMDPWINFPNPKRKAGFRRKIPGEIQWILFKK